MTGRIARADVDIAASPSSVWLALTDPTRIKKYFYGATVKTEWEPGTSITWSGDYGGQPYEDKGTILEFRPETELAMTHFSPTSGLPDVAENYHTITYSLAGHASGTHVSLTQDNNVSIEEVEHSRQNWQRVLESLKECVESELPSG